MEAVIPVSYLRPPLPPVTAGPGYYATPDPDAPGILTAWEVDTRGELHRYPVGTRWEPRCPPFDEVERAERRAARARWYEVTYFPWKIAVIEQINADPAAARAAFTRRYPQVAAKEALRARERERRELHRAVDELLAAVRAERGVSVAAIARQIGTAWQTATNRIVAGRAAWAADPAAAEQLLTRWYAQLLDAPLAERLVADLVEAGRRIGDQR